MLSGTNCLDVGSRLVPNMAGVQVRCNAHLDRFSIAAHGFARLSLLDNSHGPQRLNDDRRHGLQKRSGVGAASWSSEHLTYLACESSRDVQPDQLLVVRHNRRTSLAGVGDELDLRRHDRHCAEFDVKCDLHLMDFERIGVMFDVHARRFGIAHHAYGPQQIACLVDLRVVVAGVQQRQFVVDDFHCRCHISLRPMSPTSPGSQRVVVRCGIVSRMRFTPVVGTLGYLWDRDLDQVLLIRRNARTDDDHFGKVNGLGGKVEPDEDIVSSMRRELFEEAGVSADQMALRGTLTFTNFGPKREQWLVFVFLITEWSGELLASNAEGTLEWVPRRVLLGACEGDESAVRTLPMWPGDRHFVPLVFDGDERCFHGTMPYDGDAPLAWGHVRL